MQQAAADREMFYSVAQAWVADETYDITLMSSATHVLVVVASHELQAISDAFAWCCCSPAVDTSAELLV